MELGFAKSAKFVNGALQLGYQDNLQLKISDLTVMEPVLSTCTKTSPSTASSHPADCHDLRAPEEHIWPAILRNPSAILQPLSFPETPKEDLSLFTDPSKDQPICCLICDQTFSSKDCDSSEPRQQTQDDVVLSESALEKELSVDVALKVDKKEEVESGEREERVRGKEGSKVTLQPKDEWLRHLLLEHKIVIHQVSEICSLKWYGDN